MKKMEVLRMAIDSGITEVISLSPRRTEALMEFATMVATATRSELQEQLRATKDASWQGLTEEDFQSEMFSITSLGVADEESIKSICRDAERRLREKNGVSP